MSNINFANPYWLLLIIPIIALIVVPFVLVCRGGNLSKRKIITFVMHIFLGIFITLSLAGMTYEAVITETNVYVLADVSYSCDPNLDLVDSYVDNVKSNLPKNSKMGVIAFATDIEQVTPIGGRFNTIKNNHLDRTSTDIASALTKTATLFKDDVIKRIVIITDGNATNDTDVISVVENLSADNIYVDAMYVDNNIKEDVKEVQINTVSFTKKSYMNSKQSVSVLIQSNYNTNAVLTLSSNGSSVSETAVSLTKGLNVANVALSTTEAGTFDYDVVISNMEDKTETNNSYSFTQTIVEKAKILFISDVESDRAIAQKMYQTKYDVDYYIGDPNIPYTINDLCNYDEFVLSNLDVRNLNHSTQLIGNIDSLVSKYGKSLTTLGNTYIHANADGSSEELNSLSNILPVNYGNKDKDEKEVTIVIDTSRSMENIGHFIMAKAAACKLLDLLDDKDRVSVVGFYGDVVTIQPLVRASERESIKEKINALEAQQGTFLGTALKYAYDRIYTSTSSKREMILVSDGMPYDNGGTGTEASIARTTATACGLNNIPITTINTQSDQGLALLNEIATLSLGKSYYCKDLDDVENVLLSEVAADLTEVVVEDRYYDVSIDNVNDSVVETVITLPQVHGFYYSSLKSGTTTVLSVKYQTTTREYIVPLYSYWSYGSGKVSSFGADISTFWLYEWTTKTDTVSSGMDFLESVAKVNVPKERIDTPLVISLEQAGTNTNAFLSAPSINSSAIISMDITTPNNDIVHKDLVYNGEMFVTSFDSSIIGNYTIQFNYKLGTIEYTDTRYYSSSYSPEYDSFQYFEASNLYYMVNNNGKVSEDGNLKITNDQEYVTTFTYDFTLLLMILSVVLFIIDIIIRKVKWEDIKTWFSKRKKVTSPQSPSKELGDNK